MVTKKDVCKNLIIVAAIASLIFVIASIILEGPFLGTGDYYEQQIAFYKHAHQFIRNGNWLWDWNSELGTEFIPTFAFYLTFSPFFLITLLFPNSWVMSLMPILIVFKLVLSDACAILFFKDKFKKIEFVYLAAFLYTFCGWMFDSLFFNHFIEVMAIFPLYLWSFDNVVKGKKKYLFCLLTAASLLINYFFWFGEVIFIAMYFIVRLIFDRNYGVTKEGFIRFIIEGLLGVGLTCIFLLPIINTVFQNPRANAKLSGEIFTFENVQMYFSIIRSAFQFPNPIMWQGDWFHVLDFGCPSQTLYIPAIGVFLIPIFFVKSKRIWLKIFLCVLSIFAMVPILNSSFALFSSTYYCRWFYMFTFFLIWASISFLDDFNISENKKSVFLSSLIIIVIYGICCFAGYVLHIRSGALVYWNNIYYSVFAVFASWLIFLLCAYISPNKFYKLSVILATISILLFYAWGIYYYHNTDAYKDEGYKEISNILNNKIEDDSEFYRIYNLKYLNTGLLYNKSSILGYNSIVPASVYKFYEIIGDEREVKSWAIQENSPLLNIFSTKYIFDNKKNEWILNQDYLPMGIIFKDLEGVFELDRLRVSEYNLSQKLYIDKLIYNKYKHLDIDIDEIKTDTSINIDGIDIAVENFRNKTIYKYNSKQRVIFPNLCNTSTRILVDDENVLSSSQADCINGDLYVSKRGNIKVVCEFNDYSTVYSANLQNMEFSQYGFAADSNLDSEELVFFTIPYDDLWDAYIDGEKVDIIKGDNAFIVLDIPSGNHHIEILYNTKYYKYGGIITLASMLLFAGYIIINKKIYNKKASI